MLVNNAPNVIEYTLKPNSSEWGWSDYYGANFVASNYCNLSEQTNDFFWHHGLVSPWESLCYEHIVFNMKNKKMRYFVSSSEQSELLIKNGFSRAKAIGLPIVYVELEKTERIKNSLLIMPSHTLVGQLINNKSSMLRFIDIVNEYKKYYDKIGVCLHKNDIENNYWVEEFNSLGIEILLGAQNNDKNTYYRQAYYYSTYDTILTNDFGSHVAYALFFGCKVSISEFSLEIDLLMDGTWQRNPESINHIYSDEFISMKDSFLRKFYVSPLNAITDISLGKQLVGYNHKVSPFKMRLFFGWSILGKIYWKIIFIKDLLMVRTRLKQFFKK
jgi:hypothetical protein